MYATMERHQPAISLANANHVSYMEKHRVYEMFNNMIKMLVMHQPADHLRFLLWYLKNKLHVDLPKIIFIAPPQYTNKVYIALSIAKSTGAITIDRRNVLHRHWRKKGTCPEDFPTMLVDYMKAKGCWKKGWILLDIPKNKDEADKLIGMGIIPAHTIVLEDHYGFTNWSKYDMFDKQYKKMEFELKTVFSNSLKHIDIFGKSFDTVLDLCLEQVLYKKPLAAPFIPRIVIIGPIGSRRFSIAKSLSEKLKIVHIDANQIFSQKILGHSKMDSVFSHDSIPIETIYGWIKSKITTNKACLTRGYVLTGFPRSRNDIEWLDSIEFPPNRIIFLGIDLKQLFDHLENRCIDKNTGTFISLEKAARDVKKDILKLDQLQRQPMQLVKLFKEYKMYGEQLKDMLHYCGDDCFIVYGDGSLYDRIMHCVMSGSPATKHRPQNRFSSRLTMNLFRKMAMSYQDICETRHLSEDAHKLALALGQNCTQIE